MKETRHPEWTFIAQDDGSVQIWLRGCIDSIERLEEAEKALQAFRPLLETQGRNADDLFAFLTLSPGRHLYRTRDKLWALSYHQKGEPKYFSENAVKELLETGRIYAPAGSPHDQWYEVAA